MLNIGSHCRKTFESLLSGQIFFFHFLSLHFLAIESNALEMYSKEKRDYILIIHSITLTNSP